MTMRQAGTSDLEAGHLAPTRGADRLSITLFQRSRAMTNPLLPGWRVIPGLATSTYLPSPGQACQLPHHTVKRE